MIQKIEYVVAIPDDLYRAAHNVLMAIGHERKSMLDEAADELRAALAKYDGYPQSALTAR